MGKKILIGSICSFIIGGATTIGLAQIPAVSNLLIKNSTNTTTTDIQDQAKLDELELNNGVLKAEVNKLTTDLNTANEQIKEKDAQILAKTEQIVTLTQEKADIQAELDTYKNLVGSDANYLEIINELQTELNVKTTALNSATAELEQLRVDKEALSTRVVELETELAKVQEELANYKSLGDIDTLNVENFNGTWYEDGEFKDYYTITNGTVVHNSNEDTGSLTCLYNQMALFMTNNGRLDVNLSVDGNSFTTEDGSVYKKFYINTTETIVSDVNDFAGSYSYEDKTIDINADNTIKFVDNNNTYYGAYTATASKRNIGGNVKVTNLITANIDIDGVINTKTFTFVSGDNFIIDNETNESYNKLASTPILLTKFGNESYQPDVAMPETDYLRVIVRTDKQLEIESGTFVYFAFSNMFYATDNGSNLRMYNAGCCNGLYVPQGGFPQVKLYNSTDNIVSGDLFEFRFYNMNNKMTFQDCLYYSFSSSPGYWNLEGNCSIVSITEVGNVSNYQLWGNAKKIFNENTSVNTIDCNPIYNLTDGIYTADTLSMTLAGNTATINVPDMEEITASNVVITANTDGYKIYHTATITYVVEEVTHTIVINLENDNLVSSTLDTEEITFIKE